MVFQIICLMNYKKINIILDNHFMVYIMDVDKNFWENKYKNNKIKLNSHQF